MELLSGLKSEKKSFNYFGKGGEFAPIFFKNLVLCILTLGFYIPWARVEILKYHYSNTELDKSRFSFNGKASDITKPFFIIWGTIVLLYIGLFVGASTKSTSLLAIIIPSFYLLLFLFIPFLIHNTIRYQASKSSWKNYGFTYLGDKMELFWKYLIGIVLSIFTLGIYSAWFEVDIRKYMISHLRLGSLSFDFHGKGETLLWIHVKFLLLYIPTLGIYSFWYFKELLQYYWNNTTVTQDGKEVNFKLDIKAGDVFELVIINALLIMFTFGIAMPWVKVRTFKFMFRFLEIEEGLPLQTIQKVTYDTAHQEQLSILEFNIL